MPTKTAGVRDFNRYIQTLNPEIRIMEDAWKGILKHEMLIKERGAVPGRRVRCTLPGEV